MKYTTPASCLSMDLLLFVRDERPTVDALLEWLGSADTGRYYVLHKAGLLTLEGGIVCLSPDHTSSDGKSFFYGNMGYYPDDDKVDYICRRPSPPKPPDIT